MPHVAEILFCNGHIL